MSDIRRVRHISERQILPEDLIRNHIHRILGSENLAPPVELVLAKLEAGDRATLRLFLTDRNIVDQSEVVRFANLHLPYEAFVIDINARWR